jgi:hypothetical protein
VRSKWDEIKKAQPQVKEQVEPIQVSESERIKKEIETFANKVCCSFQAASRQLPGCFQSDARHLPCIITCIPLQP